MCAFYHEIMINKSLYSYFFFTSGSCLYFRCPQTSNLSWLQYEYFCFYYALISHSHRLALFFFLLFFAWWQSTRTLLRSVANPKKKQEKNNNKKHWQCGKIHLKKKEQQATNKLFIIQWAHCHSVWAPSDFSQSGKASEGNALQRSELGACWSGIH